MSFIKKLFSAALLTVLALTAATSLVSAPTFAADLTPSSDTLCGGGCAGINPSNIQGGRNGIVGFIITIAQILTFIFAAVAVLFLVWGGVQYITSSGDSDRIKNAKATILNAIIGLIVTIVAYAIVGVISNLLKGTVN
jgi:hypothetical protein